MGNFEKLNLKVKIQILDTNDQILLQSTINQNDVNDLRVYQGVSLVDETYLMLLETLKQKIDSESISPNN
ncbi:hypothetical protein UFOVP331_146 [uncultured Caudovirales phage]|uniref:Uncharacterized protein n=1 Tax=uncultured Caudovirales phage TaxID=2100421 RepID=A0A6J5M0F4_9CAUD|nr:hypothetical protein UFOVP331_146 [uncultured Caudovirales phage]